MQFRPLLYTLILVLFFLSVVSFSHADENVHTLWPIFDYRTSENIDYKNLNILGPLINYERRGNEFEFGLRPFWYYSRDRVKRHSYSEYLFPVANKKYEKERTSFNLLNLWNYELGPDDGYEDRLTLFPLVFYTKHRTGEKDFAFFPIGGRLHDRYFREKIKFALFPLYSKTENKGTEVTNILWPFFALIGGEKTSGFKIWPLYGQSRQEGVYRKKFVLWPFYFNYDLALNTKNPVRKRILFPLYIGSDSPDKTRKTYLWPLFDYEIDRKLNYRKWDFPWPFFRIAKGDYWHGYRFLPIISNETIGSHHDRWFIWPLYKIEEIQGDLFYRKRYRLLYFLFTNMHETYTDPLRAEQKRVALWPLFTYKREGGVKKFHTLSILEPFFPDHGGIERNWGPLWRIYQRKWDNKGNEVSSILWNLYWKERRANALAWEVFPLVHYKREENGEKMFSVLKGLFRYNRNADGSKEYRFLFLPWGIKSSGDSPLNESGQESEG